MDDGLDAAVLPAAVSPLVAAAVAGAPRGARVLAAFPTCLYLDLGAHEKVLAVLASDALALPIGLVAARASGQLTWGVRPGDHVVVGQGRVRLPQVDVVATRLRRPARVRPAPRRVGGPAGLEHPGLLGDLARDLTTSALAGASVDAAVRGLVGVGRGLTPSGDDALCGVLLTLAGVDAPAALTALSAVRSALRPVLARTTSLSAALLVAAGEGYAVPDVVRLVSRWVSGPVMDRDAAALVDRVLTIGHTSGHDLLSGVTGALGAVDEARDQAPRPTLEPAPQEGAPPWLTTSS